ncbi:hypothetical protein YTPLAS18_00340 [Nitrospira sp.]|nr:hypothetical protein YTPLAS18_00340 [Nitrospira sp.]
MLDRPNGSKQSDRAALRQNGSKAARVINVSRRERVVKDAIAAYVALRGPDLVCRPRTGNGEVSAFEIQYA